MNGLDRTAAVTTAQKESEISDLKQHADKMLREFEKFNSYSSNRAIWELVQNACDLSLECEITLDYRNNSFTFSHNGDAFTTNTLLSLIKQVSGKYRENEEIPEVGKYGTGFLTTHSMARKIELNSVLRIEDSYIEINKFIIDRTPREWKELSNKIREQIKSVYSIVESGKVVDIDKQTTTFKFRAESDQEYEYITKSKDDLLDYFPIVLTINNRLKKVTIINSDSDIIVFKREHQDLVYNDFGINLYKTTISKNEDSIVFFSLKDVNDSIDIVLPIDINQQTFDFPKTIARLFLYYPLIESENFGLNFIINCNKFLPTVERDGIFLKSDLDQVLDQEKENRRILKKVQEMIFAFIESNVLPVNNPLKYATVTLNQNLVDKNEKEKEYFNDLQIEWTRRFKELELVRINTDIPPFYKKIKECYFLGTELLEDSEAFDSIYSIVSLFYVNIPTKEDMVEWSHKIIEWGIDEDINLLNHNDLASNISTKELSDFNKEHLLKYYKVIVDNNKKSLFDKYSLLPNIDGKFQLLSQLKVIDNLPIDLVNMGRVLIPKATSLLIDDSFCFDFELTPYKRTDFANSVKNEVDEVLDTNIVCLPDSDNLENYIVDKLKPLLDKKDLNLVGHQFYFTLLNYCKLTTNISSNSKPTNLMKLICKYYGKSTDLIKINKLEDDSEGLNLRSVRRKVAQNFFYLLSFHSDKWVESNLKYLLEVIECDEDSLKEAYLTACIYPNQLNQLVKKVDLYFDIGVDDEIKDLYDKVTKNNIRNRLANIQFNSVLKRDDDKNEKDIKNQTLAHEIETIFFSEEINNINNHSFKPEILKIILLLSDEKYKLLYPRLNEHKARIMLDVVENEKTKDSIFSVITLDEKKLQKIGSLINAENFDSILNKAETLIEQEKQDKSNFQHKYKIGTYIEKEILKLLSCYAKFRVDYPKNLETASEQGGQDIIIYYEEEAMYYIEVKSRWNSRNSVMMSKLQLERAMCEQKNYALVSVDITKYQGNADKYELSLNEIIPLIKVLDDIGKYAEPLVKPNVNAENDHTSVVTLTDYRGIVNQESINAGVNWEEFASKLAKVLEQKIKDKI